MQQRRIVLAWSCQWIALAWRWTLENGCVLSHSFSSEEEGGPWRRIHPSSSPSTLRATRSAKASTNQNTNTAPAHSKGKPQRTEHTAKKPRRRAICWMADGQGGGWTRCGAQAYPRRGSAPEALHASLTELWRWSLPEPDLPPPPRPCTTRGADRAWARLVHGHIEREERRQQEAPAPPPPLAPRPWSPRRGKKSDQREGEEPNRRVDGARTAKIGSRQWCGCGCATVSGHGRGPPPPEVTSSAAPLRRRFDCAQRAEPAALEPARWDAASGESGEREAGGGDGGISRGGDAGGEALGLGGERTDKEIGLGRYFLYD